MTDVCLHGRWNGKQVIAIDDVRGYFSLPAFSRLDTFPESAVTCNALKVSYRSVLAEKGTRIILCERFLVFRLEYEQIPLGTVVQVVRPTASVEGELRLDSSMKPISHVLECVEKLLSVRTETNDHLVKGVRRHNMDPRVQVRIARTTNIVQLNVIRRNVDLIQTETLRETLPSIDHIDLVMGETGSLTDEIPHIGNRVDPLHRCIEATVYLTVVR